MATSESDRGDQMPFGLPSSQPEAVTGKRQRTGWTWMPLSFIFVMFGIVIGLAVGLLMRANLPRSSTDLYAMELQVVRSGESSLHVKWNRSAPPIQAASRGLLHISDGGHDKVVELDLLQLQTGSVIYRKATNQVRFRLEVFAKERVSISESLDYQEP
jgi:hypothetical protein